MKWKIKWKSLYWNERESDDRISFYDYCIDESNDGKFRSNKEDKDWEIPRLSLLSETIRSLDYLDEHHIIDRERRRKIEDFLLILTWYSDKKCGKNHFWQCLVEPSDGLSAVSSKAIKYLDEGVELKKVEMKINSRENAESAFGIMAIRSKVRRMISSGNYVTSSGRFSSAAASKFLSGRILRCKNIVEEEIVRRISGIETEGRISHFEIDISRRQILRIAEMCGWKEPGTNVEDSVYKLLEERRNTRLRENKRNKRRILQYCGLFGKIRAFDLAGNYPINSRSRLMILDSSIRDRDVNLNAKKQQQFNLGNIVFPDPVDWSDDDGFLLDTVPAYGDYRTGGFCIITDLQDKEVEMKPDYWFRSDDEVWEYSEEEIDEKNAINIIFHILLNRVQRESLSRYEKRIEKYVRGSNRTNHYGSVRSPYPLFLPLGNAVRDMQNYWDDQNRKITGEYYVSRGRGNY
tara:strand:+ start:23 stop:1408 length:1386 start_codon:yes stop_codon:yes gene_type:complete